MIGAYQDACKAYSPKQESRAYDDGAPQYQKLVDEITARAVKENWIPAATSRGSRQLIAPDVIPMPSKASFEDAPGSTLEMRPELSSDHDAAAGSAGSSHTAIDESPADLVDTLKSEHGGLKQKLPLDSGVLAG